MKDYLKYWRVIRYWVKYKYGLSTPELEMLLFLYSEKVFSKKKFEEYEEIMSWDIKRFNRLLRDGWIQVFRRRVGKHAQLYQLSYKSNNIMKTVYSKLDGSIIGESPQINPLFKDDVTYIQRRYREAIKRMNKEIQELKRKL